MTTITELTPIFDSAKSFYRKAFVSYDMDNYTWILHSYETPVCSIEYRRYGWKFRRIWNGYSATTMRHINEFVKQFGRRDKTISKAEWLSLPVKEFGF